MDEVIQGTIMQEVDSASNAMLMLDSSLQALVESYINRVESDWYYLLENDLVVAQRLVRDWRNQGTLYFNQEILSSIIDIGSEINGNKNKILSYYDILINEPNNEVKRDLDRSLVEISNSMSSMNNSIESYESKLKSFGSKMEDAHNNIAKTIDQIQLEEAEIKETINLINKTIELLDAQIKVDKQAIAKAKAKESRAKNECVWGIVLAPFTAGISLVLTGIGVASIAEAEEEINELKNNIKSYQKQLNEDQSELEQDQKEVALLKGLLLSTNNVLGDLQCIDNSLDGLKTSWLFYFNSFSDIIRKLHTSQISDDYILGKAWFLAACNEWNDIIPATKYLRDGIVNISRDQF